MPETVTLQRVLTPDQATTVVGTPVDTFRDPTLASPQDGDHTRILDADTGDTIALITRLSLTSRRNLRNAFVGTNFGSGVARHNMTNRGATFGYAPAKPMARLDGCRASAIARDRPDIEAVLDTIAEEAAETYRELHPDQAKRDDDYLSSKMLDQWRIGEQTYWTSGIINDANVLPYHRDGNNFPTWSAMPTLRYGMAGGHLHLPEYDLVFPCGDGDITWFYGRGLVHGVTNMRRRKPNAYRYSVVYYALKGMANCAEYAEETRLTALRRTERERAEAARIRSSQGLPAEPA